MTKSLKPILDHVIVSEIESGDTKTKSGIIIRDDVGKDHGIRPRWAQILAVGPEQEELTVGQWILIENGRWTAGVELRSDDGQKIKIHKVDYPTGIMGVMDERPSDLRGQA